MKDIIEYTTKNLIHKANDAFRTAVPFPKIKYKTNTINCMGEASYYPYKGCTLILSKDFIKRDLDWVLQEIVPHEVAHLVDFWLCYNVKNIEEVHNDRWKLIATYLGSSGAANPEYII